MESIIIVVSILKIPSIRRIIPKEKRIAVVSSPIGKVILIWSLKRRVLNGVMGRTRVP